MTELEAKISELEVRLDQLMRNQIDFQVEVLAIRKELSRLRGGTVGEKRVDTPAMPVSPPPVTKEQPIPTTPASKYRPPSPRPAPTPTFGYTDARYERTSSKFEEKINEYVDRHTLSARANLEKFIGENLISKIGILILIIGIGIGVKYSIDNNLISPLTRVILGYIFGFGLIGVAIKLKARYHNFSAVLISGGISALYFVTYFGFTLYSLLNRESAFGLMAIFTVAAVTAALVYNRQVIAHIGLVGAYAVPFLLSSDSGNYLFLFTYMSVIMAGILAISVKRKWVPLFYTASAFTWIIFGSWFAARYDSEYFSLALIFLAMFFAIFFAAKFVQTRINEWSVDAETIAAVTLNSVIFYSFCLGITVLSDSTFAITTLFIYIALVSVAILLSSFYFFGKALVYVPFAAVWLNYAVWYAIGYDPLTQFVVAAGFAGVFFAIFYLTTIAFRMARESFNVIENSALILTNAFLFYGFGYSILDGQEFTKNYLGLYTAGHGVLHLAVASVIGRMRENIQDVVQVLTVLILTFATIAIPVQFDGNVVTLVWAVEAALLFWIGRSHEVELFEYFSYPLMILASISLIADWTLFDGEAWRPVANGQLITALVFAAAFGFIYRVNRDEYNTTAIPAALAKLLGYLFAAIAMLVLYNAFRLEIVNYFNVTAANMDVSAMENVPPSLSSDLRSLSAVWQVNYSLFFLTVMGAINQFRVRSTRLAAVNCALAILTLFLFATLSMALFYDLRLNFQEAASTGDQTNVAIRYISYVFAAAMLVMLYRYVRDELLDTLIDERTRLLVFEGLFYSFTFIVGSCELINLMAQFYIADATKFGLSIFWGLYALAMVILGIAWDKKHLRIAAIALLGVTLAKLFFYDISDLGTIPKTVLFMTLGMTLLFISFLYNKYKAVIFPTLASSVPEEPKGSVTES